MSAGSAVSRSGAGRGAGAAPGGGEVGEAPAAGGLVGREGALGELSGLVGRERLVTLCGAPGIGKSRLAFELAGRCGEGFGGGVGVVELASVERGSQVAGAVASVFSVEGVAGGRLVEGLVARLSRRRVLLVLDNCEHVLSGCAGLVGELLSGCGELSVLATSREPLGVDGEVVWGVPALPVPGVGVVEPGAVGAHAAVALFVERARAVQPGFALRAHLAGDVGEVCRRLDGVPLAIELAAARVGSLTPGEIARRLDDRFGLLVGERAGGARHGTLEAALDWSHELLSGRERALLRRLSVFAGGFEVEAAEAVCGGGELGPGEVAGLLGALCRKSLVARGGGDRGSPGRARLLETVRAYAAKRLERAGETAAMRSSHARFHLALAERAEPELTGPGQRRWLERLEAERANLRLAIEWSLSQGQTGQALGLAGALTLFWRVRCHFAEGLELLDATLQASVDPPPHLHAKALWGKGFMALMTGDIDTAIDTTEQSLTRYRRLDHQQGTARALMLLGNARQARDGPASVALLDESAARARAAGDAWCLTHALTLAGFGYCARYEPDTARALFEECVSVAREAGDRQGLRFGLIGLGKVAFAVGDLGPAGSLLEEAVAAADELAEDYSGAVARMYLGEVALARGDDARADELADAALALTRESGSPFGLADLLVLKGRVSHARGQPRRARELFEQALASSTAEAHAPALAMLGGLAAEEHDRVEAARRFEQALRTARQAGQRVAEAEALAGLAELARAEGDPRRAAALHDEALALRWRIGSVSGVLSSLDAVAGLAAADGRHEEAARLLGAAGALRAKRGHALTPAQAARCEASQDLVRERLSPAALETALADGAGMSLSQAAATATKAGRLGGRPSSGWSSLSERERHVVAVASEGLTNPEIADRLFISLGTVKRHLARVYRKLGVANRGELVREVRRRGGVAADSEIQAPRGGI